MAQINKHGNTTSFTNETFMTKKTFTNSIRASSKKSKCCLSTLQQDTFYYILLAPVTRYFLSQEAYI